MILSLRIFAVILMGVLGLAGQSLAASYNQVHAIFQEHCLDCHAAQDPEGQLVMENFETLLKGGESGPALVPGKSGDSLLVKMVEGVYEKDGKKKIMPPGKRKKLAASEIALIKEWIDSGAAAPAEPTAPKTLVIPKIIPKSMPPASIQAMAYHEGKKLLAIGKYGKVEVISTESRQSKLRLETQGAVNAVEFSPDGLYLFTSGGEAGLNGQAQQWQLSDGALVRAFSRSSDSAPDASSQAHTDAIYALAIAPDGKTMATGSYDQKVKLWDIAAGKLLRTLSGHNGAIYGLAFRPDGKILASASADRTVKLWQVDTGERRDTLSQSLKELHTIAFAPDGKRLAAAGVDNRIRVWQISPQAAETTNPLLFSKFAHEGSILKIAFSPDGKVIASSADDSTLKLWHADDLREKLLLEKQPDWVSSLAFISAGKTLAAGRQNGTLEFYDINNGMKVPPPKPELISLKPRGVQRGVETELRLTGKFLHDAAEIKTSHQALTAEIITWDMSNGASLVVRVNTEASLPRGGYELWAASPNGETARLKVYIDDLPQLAPALAKAEPVPVTLPATLWGELQKMGDEALYEFEAKAGQTLIFETAARKLGSKAVLVASLQDQHGRVLLSDTTLNEKKEAFFAYTFPEAGRYRLNLHDLTFAGSADHFFRIVAGALPYVTAVHPLSAAASSETEVQLIGYNLPQPASVKIQAPASGEAAVPFPSEQFRGRDNLSVVVIPASERLEAEPNDSPATATPFGSTGFASGRIWKEPAKSGEMDVDFFRFSAKAGEKLAIETFAAQRGSPVDTKIEVLKPDGSPIQRLVLQAVRDSAVTFRGIDSNTTDIRVENWEEMELNEYLYMQGEVAKLFRAPQGPDSGFLFYASAGKRRNYFDTSAAAHALDEPCYIVEPHQPGARLPANGLPVFPIYYSNDDDAWRKQGVDSRLYFTAPADGDYVVRITDTRALQAPDFVYRLSIRPARPDFTASLQGANPTVAPGSGQSFTIAVERQDEFEGPVTIDISGAPEGFTISSPLLVEAGHNEARGVINASIDAPAPTDETGARTKIVATAMIDGKKIAKEVNNFGRIRLGEKPKLSVALEPASAAHMTGFEQMNLATAKDKPLEIILAPGQSIPAWLKVKRAGHEDLVTFTVDNLPHGVIVDNIGLNGVLIPKGENERQIFLTAAKWVPEQDRLCFAIENQAGRQCSRPVLLRIRRPAQQAAAPLN